MKLKVEIITNTTYDTSTTGKHPKKKTILLKTMRTKFLKIKLYSAIGGYVNTQHTIETSS
jgi:hypothetical protein